MSNQRQKRTVREWLLRVLTVFISLFVALLSIEIVLRLTWPQVFSPHPRGMYSPDDDVGYVLTSGFEGEFSGVEFHVSVRTNGFGLRGKNPRVLKKNSVGILCLGDSFTWGWGTNDDEAYPAVLESLLQRRYSLLDVQVLNAGVPGYGNDEELEFLKKWGPQLKPDLVIVQFFAGNDFGDNFFPARRTHEVRDGMLYQVHQDTERTKPIWLRAINWLRKYSHLVSLARNKVRGLAIRAGFLADLVHVSSKYFTDEDARRATALLVEIHKVTERIGAKALFLFVPDKVQIMSRPQNPLRASTVVQAAATLTRAPWIDLTPEFVRNPDLQKLYFA